MPATTRKNANRSKPKTSFDSLVYSTEKLVSDNRDKLPESDASAIDAALETAKKALEEGSVQDMESAYEGLTQASHQVAAVLYQSASAEGGAGASGAGAENGDGNGPSSQDDEVIDAEYVDVDAEEQS